MPGRSGTIPGQEIIPGIRIRAWEALKTIKNDETKFLMKCILRSIFRLQIFKFPMLTHVCGVARGSQGLTHMVWCEALSVIVLLRGSEA